MIFTVINARFELADININRKMLADLAAIHAAAFYKISRMLQKAKLKLKTKINTYHIMIGVFNKQILTV